jgi:hypothetical protein
MASGIVAGVAILLAVHGVFADHLPTQHPTDPVNYDGGLSPGVGASGTTTSYFDGDGYDFWCFNAVDGQEISLSLTMSPLDFVGIGLFGTVTTEGAAISTLGSIIAQTESIPPFALNYTPNFSGPVTAYVSTGNGFDTYNYELTMTGGTAPSGACGPTPTDTPTSTATATETPTDTPTPTDTATATNTPTDTPTPTNTPVDTATPTNTPTLTSTPTETPTATATESGPPRTHTPANTATPSSAIVVSDEGVVGEVPEGAVDDPGGVYIEDVDPDDTAPPPAGFAVFIEGCTVEVGHEDGDDLEGEITLTCPVTAEQLDGVNPDTLGVWMLVDGHWTYVGGEYDAETGVVRVTIDQFGTYALMGGVLGVAVPPQSPILAPNTGSGVIGGRGGLALGLAALAAGAGALTVLSGSIRRTMRRPR